MSRIGILPVELSSDTKVSVNGDEYVVSGKLGTLKKKLPKGITISVDGNIATVARRDDSAQLKALHGTTRAHLSNMSKGVSEGWSKTLELVGTGYRADVAGNTLNLNVGYSHPIKVQAPEGITFKVEKSDITVSGYDKDVVSQLTAAIRFNRPPEPYKGKGIKYKNEVIRRKAGKAAKTGAA
jgi:large subunit ribosomal protein L6